jgi:hypothetical protein
MFSGSIKPEAALHGLLRHACFLYCREASTGQSPTGVQQRCPGYGAPAAICSIVRPLTLLFTSPLTGASLGIAAFEFLSVEPDLDMSRSKRILHRNF